MNIIEKILSETILIQEDITTEIPIFYDPFNKGVDGVEFLSGETVANSDFNAVIVKSDDGYFVIYESGKAKQKTLEVKHIHEMKKTSATLAKKVEKVINSIEV